MRNRFFIPVALVAIIIVFQGCRRIPDDEKAPSGNKKNLTLDIFGLNNLGPTAQYEGWIIVDNKPVSTGKFTVNNNGELSKTSFPVFESQLTAATSFVLTIEPQPDPSTNPSDVRILAGDFTDNMSFISTAHGQALGVDFSLAEGVYLLATPTTSDVTDELSGVWFMDMSSGSPEPGLTIPNLPEGWSYEGWAVIDGIPVTTGKFTDPNDSDNSALFSGNDPAPPFPGEDFIQNAPAGLTFPTSLNDNDTIVITIEPNPDNSAKPFFLKPLSGVVSSNPFPMLNYQMDNTSAISFPTGIVIR